MMQKKRLERLLDQFSLAITQEEKNSNQLSPIKLELLIKHSRRIQQKFQALVSSPHPISFKTIKKQLNSLWEKIQGTTLSYTALPETAVSKFLINVAYYALSEKLAPNPPSLLDVIKLLMPSLAINLESLYTPEDCALEIPNRKISILAFDQKQANHELTMIHFLKTHLIADHGEYFIPLWIFNQLWNNLHIEQINNVYFEYDQQYKAEFAEDRSHLTAKEYHRLNGHNPITQSIAEIYQRLKLYQEDKSTLLGQLTLLCSSLYFNSIHGIGTELISGTTAELSIRQFFDYYTTLDKKELDRVLTPALKEELMKLRHCIGIYYPGEPQISIIETCMASRKELLQDAMRDQKSQLASIEPKQSKLSQLILESQIALKTELLALNKAIIQNQVEGYEQLPITKSLIEEYHIDLKVTNIDSLNELLEELSTSEINELMTDDYANNWSETIHDLETLVLLFLRLSVEKIAVLLIHLSQELKNRYLVQPDDYISLLLLLPREKQLLIMKHFINLNNIVNNVGSEKKLLPLFQEHPPLFELIWELLSTDQRRIFSNLCIKGTSVNQPEILLFLLQSLPKTQCQEIVTRKNTHGETLFHRVANHPECLQFILNLSPKTKRFESVKLTNTSGNTLLHKVSKPESLNLIMRSLSQKHRLALILIQNNEGNTVLHYPYHPQKLKVLLDYIPNNRLLDILNLKNKHGQTPLDKVMLNTDHQEKMLELIIDYLPASIHPSPTNIASLRRLAQAVINYPDLLAHLKQQLHPRLFKEIFTFKLYYVDFLNRHRQFILQGGMAMAVTAVTAYIHFSNTQTEAFNEALIDPRSNLSPILNASSHTFFTTAKEMVLPLISNITGSSYGVS